MNKKGFAETLVDKALWIVFLIIILIYVAYLLINFLT